MKKVYYLLTYEDIVTGERVAQSNLYHSIESAKTALQRIRVIHYVSDCSEKIFSQETFDRIEKGEQHSAEAVFNYFGTGKIVRLRLERCLFDD